MGKVYVDSYEVGSFEPQTEGTSGDVYVDNYNVGSFEPLAQSGYVYTDSYQVGSYSLPVPQPHFTIISYPSSLVVAPSQSFSLKVTVKNDGEADGNVTVKLRDHNNNIVDYKTKSITVGSLVEFEFSATSPSIDGLYSWTVEAFNESTSQIDDKKTIKLEVSRFYVIMQQLLYLLPQIIIIILIVTLILSLTKE